MKRCKIAFGLLGSLILGGVDTAYASQLTQAQTQKRLIQNEISQNQQRITQQKQAAASAINQAQQQQLTVDNLNEKIDQNETETAQITAVIHLQTKKIHRTEGDLQQDRSDLVTMLRTQYENGPVSYLSVLFGATSFSDFVSRFQILSYVSEGQNHLIHETESMQKQLLLQQESQKKNYKLLVQKTHALYDLKQQAISEEEKAQASATFAQNRANALTQQQQSLAKKLNLTQNEIARLKAEARQQEEILRSRSSSSSVVVPALRYQPISPQKLYAFVKMNGSAFTQSDIDTICTVARSYDVNPVLMVAITGQELDFVQNGTPYESWKLENPFDVFGSWALYHTTIAQSAAYAAQIVQVKLSVAPPSGEDAIIWINDPKNGAGSGVYATDPNWAYGVRSFFNEIESYVQ
ncbi:murein hydrolase activator EnvC family protein [Alicyclobacillus fodiniaquatilis]|uniref:Murein hydrolase activator EnvC family protein n=1 Tax=Alicyclobacillus fodiniaquatilis TaxID=1661150 RepID=A0ABW4JE25_9BACL